MKLFILGQQPSMLMKSKNLLQDKFSEIKTFTDLDLLITQMLQDLPQFILIGGAVSNEVRTQLKQTIDNNSLNIVFIEPNGPDEILSKVEKALKKQF